MTPFASLVPLAHVRDVPTSIAFYEKLGFTVENAFVPDGAAAPAWAWLRSGGAQLMLGTADAPIAPLQGVLFYVYCDDVAGCRAALVARGVDVGEITFPFYAPRGEFRVTDPDGYVLMVTHT